MGCQLVSATYLIGTIAALALMFGGMIMIMGMLLIELVLVPRHRRTTGSELITPSPPLPGQTAGMVGLCLIWPWFHRRTGTVITIDKAARLWRWIAIATISAGGVFLVSMPFVYLFIPEGNS